MIYTSDEQILEALGPYTQVFPPMAGYDALIVAYDAARYASLNPARKNLFDNYSKLQLAGETDAALQLLNEALASDQPLIDEEIDLQFGGGGIVNKSPGTIMAGRRFMWMYLQGQSYNNMGMITYTLMPPKAYGS